MSNAPLHLVEGAISPEGGETMSRAYELLYILKPDLGEAETEAADQAIQDLITERGQVEDVDVWGKRTLAYEIEDYKEGYYVILHFQADNDFPAELERQLKINDRVMRFLVTSREE